MKCTDRNVVLWKDNSWIEKVSNEQVFCKDHNTYKTSEIDSVCKRKYCWTRETLVFLRITMYRKLSLCDLTESENLTGRLRPEYMM